VISGSRNARNYLESSKGLLRLHRPWKDNSVIPAIFKFEEWRFHRSLDNGLTWELCPDSSSLFMDRQLGRETHIDFEEVETP
jgi:hypothetical protein